MKVRAIDGVGDWLYGKGKSDYKRDLNALAQNIQTSLLSFLGDCFFATNEGIAWFERLSSKDQLQLKLDISAVLLNKPEVTSIVEVSTVLSNNRRITITYSVETIYGKLTNRTVTQEV